MRTEIDRTPLFCGVLEPVSATDISQQRSNRSAHYTYHLLTFTPDPRRGEAQRTETSSSWGPLLVDPNQWRLGTASYESEKEEAAAVALQGRLVHLEESLKGRPWLVDDQTGPSLADLTVGSAILFACRFYIDREMREGIPHTRVYLRRLREVDGLEERFTINMIEKRKQA
ncbi:hypothetical protein DL768_005021 [Monosporascus sp. mg162]|nr:hypothetical protein DL768_005021 [Monosporascus sp. mg162]